jgi:hypothetical protein
MLKVIKSPHIFPSRLRGARLLPAVSDVVASNPTLTRRPLMPATTLSPGPMFPITPCRPGLLNHRRTLFRLDPAPGTPPLALLCQQAIAAIAKGVIMRHSQLQHRTRRYAVQPSRRSVLVRGATRCNRLPQGDALATNSRWRHCRPLGSSHQHREQRHSPRLEVRQPCRPLREPCERRCPLESRFLRHERGCGGQSFQAKQ